MMLGLGQFLFGWLSWKSGALPNLLAALGMIGGIAGLLTEYVVRTAVLALPQIAILAIWQFAAGIILLRTKTCNP